MDQIPIKLMLAGGSIILFTKINLKSEERRIMERSQAEVVDKDKNDPSILEATHMLFHDHDATHDGLIETIPEALTPFSEETFIRVQEAIDTDFPDAATRHEARLTLIEAGLRMAMEQSESPDYDEKLTVLVASEAGRYVHERNSEQLPMDSPMDTPGSHNSRLYHAVKSLVRMQGLQPDHFHDLPEDWQYHSIDELMESLSVVEHGLLRRSDNPEGQDPLALVNYANVSGRPAYWQEQAVADALELLEGLDLSSESERYREQLFGAALDDDYIPHDFSVGTAHSRILIGIEATAASSKQPKQITKKRLARKDLTIEGPSEFQRRRDIVQKFFPLTGILPKTRFTTEIRQQLFQQFTELFDEGEIGSLYLEFNKTIADSWRKHRDPQKMVRILRTYEELVPEDVSLRAWEEVRRARAETKLGETATNTVE